MTTPIRRRRRWTRSASWSKATRCCSPSRSSARRRTPPCKNTSTPRRCRSCSPRPARRASRIGKTHPGPLRSTRTTSPRAASTPSIFCRTTPTPRSASSTNDDLGRDYITGLKSGLGDKAASLIIGEVSYELTDPTIDSQIVKLKSLGADLLYDASTPKFAAQAIKKVADLGWKPVHILDINASPVSATLKPAGLDISKDIISTNYGKDPGDPQWKDDAGLKAYFAFMDKYYPEGDKLNTVNTYGYATAELLVYILRQCGDDLTRENIMRQATSIRNFAGSLALPGLTVNTSSTDYRINKQMQMMKFNGERWELFGPIIEDTGPSG